MASREIPFEVRKRIFGKNKSTFILAKDQKQARRKAGGENILFIRKVPIEKILGIGDNFITDILDNNRKDK